MSTPWRGTFDWREPGCSRGCDRRRRPLMDETRWQRIEHLFHSAHALPPAQRAVFLADACSGDHELEQEVLKLLAGDQRSEETVRMLIAEASHDMVAGGMNV